MKKIILFSVLALTINLTAQTTSTTYIAKPLELNTVPASVTKSDSILVRGADKIVKFVPRSTFGGGGGTPTLDQVLNAGNTMTGDINSIDGNLNLENAGFFSSNISTGEIAQLSFGGGLGLGYSAGGAYAHVKGSNITEERELQLPDASGTLAIQGDISLQKIMETGQNDGQIPNATDPDTFYKDRILLGHDFGAWSYDAGSGSGGTGYKRSSYVTNANSGGGAQIGSENKNDTASNGLYGFVQAQDGVLYLKTAINEPDGDPSGITQLIIQTPVFGAGESIYELKSKPIAGTYEVATVDQISLNEVLGLGNTATDKAILLVNGVGNITAEISPDTFEFTNSSSGASTIVTPNTLQLRLGSDFAALNSTSLTIQNSTDTTVLGFPTPNSSIINKYMPISVNGTFAETNNGDISLGLQNLVDTSNNSASKDFSGVGILQGSGAFISSYSSIGNGLSGGSQSGTEIAQNATQSSMATYWADGANETKIIVGNSIGFDVKRGANRTQMVFEDPIYSDGSSISIPSLPYARIYKMSTAEVFTNTTTSALSGTTLNSTYPQAIAGDKINCLDISGGALQYEKTSVGWISHSITVVP